MPSIPHSRHLHHSCKASPSLVQGIRTSVRRHPYERTPRFAMSRCQNDDFLRVLSTHRAAGCRSSCQPEGRSRTFSCSSERTPRYRCFLQACSRGVRTAAILPFAIQTLCDCSTDHRQYRHTDSHRWASFCLQLTVYGSQLITWQALHLQQSNHL